MTGLKDVEAKLAAATPWVRDEFAFISEAMNELSCQARDESGPGRAYRLDGPPILRVHPKRKLIGLGFPDALRDEIDAMTGGAVRSQKGATWLNYQPGTWDRDTIEVLIDKAAQAQAHEKDIATRPNPSTNAPPRAYGNHRARVDDSADLALILAVLRAFKQHETTTGTRGTLKVLRETIFFRWEAPRLPPGGKYSPLIPHSPAARERRSLGLSGGLIYEHVRPISDVINQLLDNPPTNEAELREALDSSPERIIITKDEDNALNAAGMRSTAPHAADRWSRYRAAGMDPATFTPWDPASPHRSSD